MGLEGFSSNLFASPWIFMQELCRYNFLVTTVNLSVRCLCTEVSQVRLVLVQKSPPLVLQTVYEYLPLVLCMLVCMEIRHAAY